MKHTKVLVALLCFWTAAISAETKFLPDVELYQVLGLSIADSMSDEFGALVKEQFQLKTKQLVLLMAENLKAKRKNSQSSLHLEVVAKAYKILSNPETRDLYDREGLGALKERGLWSMDAGSEMRKGASGRVPSIGVDGDSDEGTYSPEEQEGYDL